MSARQLFIVMEYFDALELFELHARNALSRKQIDAIGTQLALGITEMHQAGLVHRDIKLENVLCRIDSKKQPHIKIIDYGVACYLPSMTGACNTYAGTPVYIDPWLTDRQIARTDYKALKAADWWAFARMMHAMYTNIPVEGRFVEGLRDPFVIEAKRYRILIDILTKAPRKRPTEKQIMHVFAKGLPAPTARMGKYTEL